MKDRDLGKIRIVCSSLLVLSAVFVFLFFSNRAEASDKFWIATGPANFNDDANWSLTSGGPANTSAPGATDTATFDGNGLGNCTFTADITIGGVKIGAAYTGTITLGSGVNLTLGSFSNFVMDGGTFNTSNGTFFMNAGSPNGTFDQNGGVFNGNGTLDFNTGIVRFDGGTFNATQGTTTFGRTIVRTSGTFNHNNGTVILTGSAGGGVIGSVAFNNLTLNASDILSFDPITVLNTLNLNSGGISGTIDARGTVNIGPSFTGGPGTLAITGSAARTITFASGAILPNLTVNAPNATITSSGSGTVNFQSLTFQSGIINQGSANFLFTSYSQTGGAFNASTASFTVNAGSGTCTFSGVFNGNGPLDLDCGTITVGGGSFTASSVNTTFHRTFFHTAGTFSHNNGTANFVSTSGGGINVTAPTQFKNLTLNNTGDNFTITGTVDVAGTLKLQSGLVQNGTIQAQGNVVVENTFGFGAPLSGGSVSLTFNGNGNQTFTNNGGPNPSGSWIVNKSNGTLTAASSIVLGNNQALSITAGTLYLNNNSNLNCGALTIGAAGKLINDSSTTITLGGNASNTGTLDLEGGGITCPQSDTILLRSSVNGVRRNWSGNGVYRLVDLEVRDMGGGSATLPAIKVFSGTNSGNNNSNWTFDSNCPPNPTISPSAPFVNSGATVQFTPSGGTAPYAFSLAINNSGGNITPGGFYTAGPTKGVIDRVRVTDSFNNTGDVEVHINGPLHHFDINTNGIVTIGVNPLPVRVTLKDIFNTTLVDATNPVTISIQNNPGGATLQGTLTRTPVSGEVFFDDLQITKAASQYTLRVVSGTVSAVSDPFTVLAGVPAQLSFITQPSNAFLNRTISPFVQVGIKDAFGNTVTLTTTINLSASPGAFLVGTTSVTTSNGVATFEVNIANVASGITLLASHQTNIGSAAPSVTSTPFNVIGQVEVNNTNDFGPGSLRDAITQVNFAGGSVPSVITFNIPGTGPFVISTNNSYQPVTHSVVMDGTTQPGYSGTPLIELRGPCISTDNCFGFTGLELMAGTSTVKGLAISRFSTGIHLQSAGNIVQGNFIGTDVTGNSAQPNQIGVLQSASGFTGNLIGGTTTQQRNLISGNVTGIRTESCSSQDSVLGNLVGTNAAGTNPLPNNVGIDVLCPFIKIGGPASGEGNLIAFNVAQGIKSFIPVLARGNSIHSNGQLGIDQFPEGVNAPSPNGMQPPTLNSATSTGGSTTITGTVKSPTQGSQWTIDFYSTPTCDPSGYGEGQTYLGSTTVNFSSSGITSFNATLPVSVPLGHSVTATTSQLSGGGTTEFSQCKIGSPNVFTVSGKALTTQGVPIQFATLQLTGSENKTTSTDSNGNYSFTNLASGANYTVTATSIDYQFAPAFRTYNNLSSNQANQDFAGTRIRFSLVGSLVQMVNGNALPLTGVSLRLSGTTSGFTLGNGFYVFQNLPVGSYTILPIKAGYVFSPESFDVTITNGDVQRNFIATTAATPLPGRIVFQSGGGNVGTINADGTSLATPLFAGTKPSFSKDGKKIHYLESNTFLRTRDADGTEITSGVPNPGTPVVSIDPPAWSPDDTKVVLTTGGSDLKIVDSMGVLITTIPLPGLTQVRFATWLNNIQIVFAAVDGNDLELYKINSNGSTLVKLTNNTVIDSYPAAAPNGSKIAFLRASQSTSPSNLIVMDADGNNPQQIATNVTSRPTWSPDLSRVAFSRNTGSGEQVISLTSDGVGQRVIINQSLGSFLSWAPEIQLSTQLGTNEAVSSGGVDVGFSEVTRSGTTTITPISPSAVGTAPNGFIVGNMAFEISTTAAVTAPITVCFTVPSNTTLSAFNAMALLHNEGGVLVDRTTSRAFSIKRICGSVTTLSPFAIGEHVENLPSIHGVVHDDQGQALSDVVVQLEGSESRTTITDPFGVFHFVNLASGDYRIQPSKEGYRFVQPSATLSGLNGENMLAFTGTPATFAIGGKALGSNGAPLANVQISLDGTAFRQTVTANDGTYSFSGLAAGGSYAAVPFKSGVTFSPSFSSVDVLVANQTNLNFVAAASPGPTPSPTPSTLNYTALGDSITFGLSDTQGGFVTRYRQNTQTDLSLVVNQTNLGLPGQTSSELLSALRNDQALRSAVSNSHVVTLNIGGNDLLPVIFQYQNAQCGGTDNLDCMRSAMTLLKSNFSAILAELLLLRGTNNTVIRTMDFYNPFVGVLKSGDAWPNDGVNDFQAIKPFADDINNFIATQAAVNKIPCARVSIAFNGPHADEDAVTKGLIAADGIHPSTTGHALIADLLRIAAYAPLIPNNAQPNVQIAVGDYSVKESAGFATISVVRSGNLDVPLSVNFSTADGTAGQHDDYIATVGRLNFAAGEHLKTIPLLIVNDVNNEANETFTFTLTNPTGGALIAPASANIVVTDDDSGLQQPNPVDEARFFAQEHYFDFLNRFPDQSGWDFWTNEIVSCGTDQSCIEVKRINVSAAFFLSIEFQETGYLIERTYKTAFGDGVGQSTLGGAHSLAVPIVRLNEFLADTREIGAGLVVGQAGWEQVLENNKVRFVDEFVERPQFTQAFPVSLTESQFVDQLNSNAGNHLSAQQRDQLISDLMFGLKTRAEVLRAIAEHPGLRNAEFNRAFVLMQYFGYLRRNPNDQPDSDYTGYDFWLTKLNQFGGNFVNAEMVKAFILSGEYRHRFGP